MAGQEAVMKVGTTAEPEKVEGQERGLPELGETVAEAKEREEG